VTEHTVRAFGEELKSLKRRVHDMGALVLDQVEASFQILTDRDAERAREIAGRDKAVDSLDREIEDATLRLLALRRPVAGDFRLAMTAMRFARTLERTGDIAKNIAKRERRFTETPVSTDLAKSAAELGDLVLSRLRQVLQAYDTGAVDQAMLVWATDEEIDQRAEALQGKVLRRMAERPDEIEYLAHLLFVAKNLERIGDHATNLAEAVRYESTGEHTLEDRSRG
jgi:phosphate transport system protein